MLSIFDLLKNDHLRRNIARFYPEAPCRRRTEMHLGLEIDRIVNPLEGLLRMRKGATAAAPGGRQDVLIPRAANQRLCSRAASFSRRNEVHLCSCVYTLECVDYYTSRDKMPTNLAIDDRLLEEAQKVGGHRTKRETVTAALQEYIKRRKQQEILSLFGTIDYEPGYDYKRERKAKRA
jgi:hypothetical protein